MPLRDSVEHLPPRARAAEKARAFVRELHNGHTFERDGRTFVVEEWRFDPRAEVLEAVVASDGLAIANPLRFFNPPILVPDETTSRVALVRGGFREVSNFKEDIEEAAKVIVSGAAIASDRLVREAAESKGVSLEEALTGDPTLTVYAATSDGAIESSDAAYATARAGGALVVSGGSSGNIVGQYFSGTTYTAWEAFYSFDTSALGAAATVTGATFSIYGNNDNSGTDFTIEAYIKAWEAGGLTSADWVAGANIASLTKVAEFETASWNAAGYNAFLSGGAKGDLPGNVNKTGTTQLMIVSSRLRSGTAPAGEEYVGAYWAERVGTTQDPRLVVTYSTVTIVPIAQVTGTDTSVAMTTRRTVPAGLVTETDAALPMTSFQSDIIGFVTETDEALAMTVRRTVHLGQVTEVDAALPMAGFRSTPIGRITELNIALPMIVFRPAWLFAPPTVTDIPLTPGYDEPVDPLARRLFPHFGMAVARGRTLIKNADDSYTLTEYPSHDQLMAAKVEVWADGERKPVYYLGGHIYEVTSEERASLVAAGYGAYISGGVE